MYIFISDKTSVGDEIITTLIQTFKVNDDKMTPKLIDRISTTIHDLYTLSDEDRSAVKVFTQINKTRLENGRLELHNGHMYFDLFSVDYMVDLPDLVGESN